MSEVIIDVRERDEYEIEHIEHSINVPLSSFATVVPGVLTQLKDRKITFMCRGGLRAQQAHEQAKGLGFNDAHTYSIYEGGIVKWKESGNPVMQKNGKTPLPLMRQMQITMGILFMIFASLGAFINPLFSTVTIAFGGGLFLAGLTGDCAVAGVLAKAPWNKADPSLKDNYCKASGNCQ
jgi:rhodanese-related sulfurtransferase